MWIVINRNYTEFATLSLFNFHIFRCLFLMLFTNYINLDSTNRKLIKSKPYFLENFVLKAQDFCNNITFQCKLIKKKSLQNFFVLHIWILNTVKYANRFPPHYASFLLAIFGKKCNFTKIMCDRVFLTSLKIYYF